MKEVTEWDNNPRMMWVWDNKIDDKEKKKVVYIVGKNSSLPVITVEQNDGVVYFKHCAEIEEQKTRRMTYQELAWWLLDGIMEGKHREWYYSFLNDVHSYFDYHISDSNKPVDDDIFIREDGGEWHEPLVEVEE